MAQRPLLDRVEGALSAAGCGGSLLVAASGGLDSTVLAHALFALREPLGLELALAHVNHGLRGDESEADERFVADLAGRLGVPFSSQRVDPAAARREGSSRERPTTQEAARSLRRQALEAQRVRLGFEHIVTAHHADDQAETVLMRLLRGCGPDSLGGIPERSPDGVWVRPLLSATRCEIAGFASQNELRWREDRSNADPRYTRNRLRERVVPGLVKDFNPRLLRAIGDLAEAQRRDTEWLDALVRAEAERLVEVDPPGRLRIAALGWSERPEALARRIVRRLLIEQGGGRDLRRVHLMRVLAFLRTARAGTAIELPGGLRLSRENADSFLLERASHL